MCLYASEPERAHQVRRFIGFLFGHVPAVPVLLGDAKVREVDGVAVSAAPDHDVRWLDVQMNYPCGVECFKSGQHLVCDHERRFEREAVVAPGDQIVKTGSEKFERENSEFIVVTVPKHFWEAHEALKFAIVFGLLYQDTFVVIMFELQYDVLVGRDVSCCGESADCRHKHAVATLEDLPK